MTRLTATPLPAVLAMSLAACSVAEPAHDSFESTGEIIALSGGDAGARNACVACHGLRGQGDGNLTPRLAGLESGYIARQLENFAEGQRRHPQMSWIANRLGWQARMKVANYYASLPVPDLVDAVGGVVPAACTPEIARLYHRGDPERGIPACASCHGTDGRGVGQGKPPLADQPAPYLAQELEHWRSGKRYGDPRGIMTAISQRLHEEELVPLADYSAHLTGETYRPGPREECPPRRRPYPSNGA